MTDDESAPAFSEPGPTHEPPAEASPPEQRYVREGLIGVGGMGRVHLARDRVLRRQVALKEAATPELAARLAREAWITARLEHPGIVPVYDASGAGDAWYTMRLVRGQTLRERLRDCADLDARLALLPHLVAASQAVAFAHSMGIVHRDLKPANIMVGPFGETQVADWGLACPAPEAADAWAQVTEVPNGAVAGTARYMSPEQAAGGSPSFSSDVFSLGMALYELLSGTPPPGEAGVAPDLAALPRGVPAELVAITGRCVATEPTDRYGSAIELAEDLERWLSGRRVRAHAYTPRELLLRLLQAWRAPLAVGAVALLVVAGIGVAALQKTRAERAAARAYLAVTLTGQALAGFVAGQLPEAEVLAAHALQLGPSPGARGVLAGVAAPAARRVASAQLPPACAQGGVLNPGRDAIACAGDGRVEVWDLTEPPRLRTRAELSVVAPPVWLGEHLAVAAAERIVWLDGEPSTAWEGRGVPFAGESVVFEALGEEVRVLRPGEPARIVETCLSNVAIRAALGDELFVGCDDGVLRSWTPEGVERVVSDLGARPAWSTLVADPAGRLLVGHLDGSVQALDLRDGTWGPALRGLQGAVTRLVPIPGTDHVVARGTSGATRVGDVRLGVWGGALPAGLGAIQPGRRDGELLAAADGRLETWALEGALAPRRLAFTSGLSQVAFSEDGSRIAVALGGGDVVERQLGDGAELGRWELGEGVVKCVAPGPDGDWFASSMFEGARLLRPGAAPWRPAFPRMLRRAGPLSGGRVWTLDYEGMARAFHPRDGSVTAELTSTGFIDGASSPSQDTAAVLDDRGTAWVLVGDRWVERGSLADARAVAVGDGGSPLVLARRDAVCVDGRCFDSRGAVTDLALDGERLAVATLAGDVHLFDLQTTELVASLQGHRDRVSTVAFSPTGDRLVSGSWDQTARVWALDGLSKDPVAVLREAEAVWGLDLEEASAAVAHR